MGVDAGPGSADVHVAHPGLHQELGFWFLVLMWSGMTAVMMAPIVWPWLRALRRMGDRLPVAAFTVGYALAWSAFSAGMAALQVALTRAGVGTPLLTHAPAAAGGALLLTGAFQFTRLKEACLSHCRSPFGYFASHWAPGVRGAVGMGFHHGLHCLGCCWAVMALGLVVGMMDLRMMAVLMGVMLVETLSPVGARMVRPIGAGMVLLGGYLLLG